MPQTAGTERGLGKASPKLSTCFWSSFSTIEANRYAKLG